MDKKKYVDFMDELNPSELYEGLLGYGLFVDKLPPVFDAVPFFNYCNETRLEVSPNVTGGFISYWVTRNIGVPRLMGIPNPFLYHNLCRELEKNWDDIRNYFREKTKNQKHIVSRIHIRKIKDTNRLFEMNYSNWKTDGNPELDLLMLEKGPSRFVVHADISTCFPSIYTHSIPWAAVGKKEAKVNKRDDIWYNKIDKACSNLCEGETHGLLIGPHASNLVSEIVLTAVDSELCEEYRYIRNIDDYECFVKSREEGERFLRDLEEKLRQFDLYVNHKKTKFIELPINTEKNWKHQLSDLPKIGKHGVIEFPQVNSFIDVALTLSKETGDYAVFNYAIKKLKGMDVSRNGKELAGRRIMHIATLNPYLLNLMEEYVFTPYGVKEIEIEKFANAIYEDSVQRHDYESTSFAIYFAIKYGLKIQAFEDDYAKAQQTVIDSKDCIFLTMTWLYFIRKNHWNRTASQLKLLNKEARTLAQTDMDRYWLFCYEALSYGSLKGEWRALKECGISFIKNEFRNEP